MNPYKEVDDSSFSSVPFSYEDIASKLLKDNYFLTALELHTELVESGKELPQLREFFSNPGNFEQHVSRASELVSMHRSPSQATLDSLDTARYSEDGGGDRAGSGGDVAVLEFELRKARETINSLRANLTQFADGESALDKSCKQDQQRSLKPHEKRALNFLINEYLLLQDYKLTSITFSDENPDQDFEDWDDVGLNMPRPSGLVSMFWGTSNKINASTCDASTQVDVDLDSPVDDVEEVVGHVDWNHELLVQAAEINLLKQKIIALETDKLNYQKLYDAAIISLNSLTTPVLESKSLELKLPEEKMAVVQKDQRDAPPLTSTAAENHYGSENSTHSATPEQFEMIENDRLLHIKKDSSNTSSYDPGTVGDGSVRDSPLRRGSIATLDDALSINDAADWTRLYDYNSIENTSKEMWIDCPLPSSLKVSILNLCSEVMNTGEPLNNDLLTELVTNDKPVSLDGLLSLVADTLPRIIPHTLVSRRCDSVALLACAIHLLNANDTGNRRAKLLQLLLTLLKKPDAAETRIICEAACLIVKWGGSGELLSSIAELLTSRSTERRILASQICVSISPYVTTELCTSLLLSLVVLMCESNECEIRSLGLKSACVICPIAEHKYMQLESVFFNFLKDTSEKNVRDAVGVFLPILARSALIAGKFSTELTPKILTNLSKYSTDKEWKQLILYLDIMKTLVIPMLVYITNVSLIKDVSLDDCDSEFVCYDEVPLEKNEHCMELQCYNDGSADMKHLVICMNYLMKHKSEVRWGELDWCLSVQKRILEIAVTTKWINQPNVYNVLLNLFNSYVENFGVHYTNAVLKPLFENTIRDLETKLEKLMAVNIDTMIYVGVHLVIILPAVAKDELGTFLHKWIMYSSLRSLPVKMFCIPLKWVSQHKPESLDIYLQHLRELSATSSESFSGVSIRVFICNLISELLNTTKVTDSCIQTQLLPLVNAALHDDDVSVREAAITAWGSITRRATSQRLPCEPDCWLAIQHVCGEQSREPTARETARVAEALALLVLPDVDVGHAVDSTAVSLLCALCTRAPLTAESLSALTPGLQLVAHHARDHPALLPALRKLEESVQSPSLAQYKPAIEALLHNMAIQPEHTYKENAHKTTTNLHAAQEVGRRVSQMFQQSKTNMNIPNIFKKKS